jgi:uncharacterized protein YggE
MRQVTGFAIFLLATAAPALAAPDAGPPRIIVSGSGTVFTPPDVATLSFSVRGEGETSDGAVAQMVARRTKIDAGLAIFKQIEVRAAQVSVREVRGRECQPSYGAPTLSTGACTIIGYVAELSVTVRTTLPKQAGTIVGLVGRQGATNPSLNGFALADLGAAQRRAIAAALDDARRKAEAIAAGTSVKVGRLITVSTGSSYSDVQPQDGVRDAPPPAPPPPPPPAPPIAVDLTPQPIQTQANVTVSYEAVP